MTHSKLKKTSRLVLLKMLGKTEGKSPDRKMYDTWRGICQKPNKHEMNYNEHNLILLFREMLIKSTR